MTTQEHLQRGRKAVAIRFTPAALMLSAALVLEGLMRLPSTAQMIVLTSYHWWDTASLFVLMLEITYTSSAICLIACGCLALLDLLLRLSLKAYLAHLHRHREAA